MAYLFASPFLHYHSNPLLPSCLHSGPFYSADARFPLSPMLSAPTFRSMPLARSSSGDKGEIVKRVQELMDNVKFDAVEETFIMLEMALKTNYSKEPICIKINFLLMMKNRLKELWEYLRKQVMEEGKDEMNEDEGGF
ncbi:hypothetical protein MRB53_014530 [Persea americana]|uniref:Uncharacterized protein n=1 Tax=Persea americana TaxID=3435 RepID=A0ACC2KBI8_PERAE|nr:hypothetical protein MRB53_014530 [Persea americana]